MRRIAALVTNNLLCELVEQQRCAPRGKQPAAGSPQGKPLMPVPFVVVLTEQLETAQRSLETAQRSLETAQRSLESNSKQENSVELSARSGIAAVNSVAATFGIKVGQTIAEARARVAAIQVHTVTTEQVRRALERVAESVFKFGVTLSVEAPDTVWIDITGVAHLFGGEEELIAEVACTVRELGHSVRVVAADGARFSQACARFSSAVRERGVLSVQDASVRSLIHELPIQALPVEQEVRTWLGQLGIFQLGDLAKIPPALAVSRLGKFARVALDMLQGPGQEPLTAYTPAACIYEQLIWEDALEGLEPIRFALRRLIALIAKRLEGRGMAAQKALVSVIGDPVIGRNRQVNPDHLLEFEFVTPLYREDDLLRVIGTRLSKLELKAPCVGLRLEIPRLVPAATRQLSLEMLSSKLEFDNPERFDVLMSELSADIGHKNLGVLCMVDTHFPEKLSVLTPLGNAPARATPRVRAASMRTANAGRTVVGSSTGAAARAHAVNEDAQSAASTEESLAQVMQIPTRLFSPAIPIQAALREGALLPIGLNVYVIEHIRFEKRIDTVEWWSGYPSARDYVRLWLSGAGHCLVALAYVDRIANRRYLQALYD
jgi:protein ImuB